MTDPLAALVGRWREEAEVLRRRGAPRQAEAVESCAEELEDARHRWWTEPLEVAEAAEWGGYSESRLRSLLSADEIPNAGDPGAPRIRRWDVPRKRGRGPAEEGGSVAERSLRSIE